MPQYHIYSELNQNHMIPSESSNFLYDLMDINQAIYNLLTTPRGSRIFLAFYGTNIESILFELNDQDASDLLYKDIIDAVNYWEGYRIRLNQSATTVVQDPSSHEYFVSLVYNVVGLSETSFNYTLGISP